MKVSVRDKQKIPKDRLYEMDQNMFLIFFDVEEDEDSYGNDADDNDGGGDEDLQATDGEMGDDFADQEAREKNMETDQTTHFSTPVSGSTGTRTHQVSAVNANTSRRLEESVLQKVLGGGRVQTPLEITPVCLLPDENISADLLEGTVSQPMNAATQEVIPAVNVSAITRKNIVKGKKKWGLVVATRTSSRIQKDGRTAVEKAQEILKAKNLEVPKSKNFSQCISNSFAVLDNATLMQNAINTGITLGDSEDNINDNINIVKETELDRLNRFHSDHPDMFLPKNIDISTEEINPPVVPIKENTHSNAASHPSDELLTEAPWTEVSSGRKNSRKQLQFSSK